MQLPQTQTYFCGFMPDIENKIEASKQAHAPNEKKRAG
jgi:hypothetical protein